MLLRLPRNAHDQTEGAHLAAGHSTIGDCHSDVMSMGLRGIGRAREPPFGKVCRGSWIGGRHSICGRSRPAASLVRVLLFFEPTVALLVSGR